MGHSYADLEALEQELKPFFGQEGMEMLLRRAGRAAGRSATAAAGNLDAALASVSGLPLQRSGDSWRMAGSSSAAAEAWCAGFLEGCEPDGRAVTARRSADGVEFTFGSELVDDRDTFDFQLPASGPLTPRQLALVADLSDDAILFVDREKRVRAWNKGAEALFGYRAEEAIGRYFDLLVPEDLLQRGELDWISRETERTGTLRHYVTRRKARDGRELLVSLTRTLVRSRNGELVGYGVILRDVTEPEELKQQLHEARRLAQVGELAAQVAHEVRNPLAGIHGALQVLRRRLPLGPEEERVFDAIAREIARLDHLVTDLLRFGRPARARLERLDLAHWLEEWLRRMHGEAQVRRAVMDLHVRSRPLVDADPLFLEQVLRNLFENSVEACSGPCAVRLALDEQEGRARLLFHDDGPGIPEELRSRVLQPFFTTKARGSGLGLPICSSLLAALGGRLAVLPSEHGALIEVTLPRADGGPAP